MAFNNRKNLNPMKITTKLPEDLPEVIYYFRHGESIGNALGKSDESLKNIPNHMFELTQRGIIQARKLSDYILRNEILYDVSEIYESGFIRSQQTLDQVLIGYEEMHPIIQDNRLDEWWKGIFHSLNEEDIQKYYPLENKIALREGWHHYIPPQGESGKNVEQRIKSFLSDLKQNSLISGHGRYAGFLNRILCGEEIEFNCNYITPKNCELWMFEKTNRKYEKKVLYVPNI